MTYAPPPIRSHPAFSAGEPAIQRRSMTPDRYSGVATFWESTLDAAIVTVWVGVSYDPAAGC